MTFLSKLTYSFRITIRSTTLFMHPTTCLKNLGARMDLVNDTHLQQQCRMQNLERLNTKLQIATKQSISVVGATSLTVHIGDMQICIWLSIVEILADDVLFGRKIYPDASEPISSDKNRISSYMFSCDTIVRKQFRWRKEHTNRTSARWFMSQSCFLWNDKSNNDAGQNRITRDRGNFQ